MSKQSSEELTEDAMIKETQEFGKLVREILPQVNVVDGFNKEGQEVVSDDEDEEDDEDDDEDDEDDDDEDDDEDEEGQKLPGGANEAGEIDSEDDDDDEEGEDEEDEDEDDEEGEATAEKSAVGLKRAAESALEKGGSKRQNQEISS